MFSSNTSQVSNAATYIEDVFSTWLYTGNASTQTITNGIDLAGKGGMIWLKQRNGIGDHGLLDTTRGAGNVLSSNTTASEAYYSNLLSSFNSNGFTLGSDSASGYIWNGSPNTYASWTFRKQPKFFDVVTYTGNGSSQNIAHNLGSVPGCIIVKSTSTVNDWRVYHRSLATVDSALRLNSTAAVGSSSTFWNSTAPTSTQFTVGSDGSVNANGATYVAYLFAHNAGGFGLTGTDNVISCGAYTGNGSASGPVVTLNYEPQWLIIKKIGGSGGAWWMADTMRGFDNTSDQFLWANSSTNEIPKTNYVKPTATGFQIVNTDFDVNEAGANYIYIAIRRGPMKTPTSGTSVFQPVTYTGNGTARTTTTGIVTDLLITRGRNHASYPLNALLDRLRGATRYLLTNSYGGTYFGDQAEATGTNTITSFANMSGVGVGTDAVGYCNIDTIQYVNWALRRAPGFFDEVCYDGNSVSGRNITHNLTVAPELVVIKARTKTDDWVVRSSAFPTHGANGIAYLNLSGAASNAGYSYVPTTTTFQVESNNNQNGSGYTYVAYLFASCPGVSKVGSYTGTGSTQTINCGFTGGARFLLIKRTDASANWWVWDTARGMVSGTDPRLPWNANTVESNADWVYTTSVGFQIVTTDATVNANGGTYLYMAVA